MSFDVAESVEVAKKAGEQLVGVTGPVEPMTTGVGHHEVQRAVDRHHFLVLGEEDLRLEGLTTYDTTQLNGDVPDRGVGLVRYGQEATLAEMDPLRHDLDVDLRETLLVDPGDHDLADRPVGCAV